MENNKFDYLVPEISKKLSKYFLNSLHGHMDLSVDIDTSPLLNLTTSVFIGSLINVLDAIKENTIGEIKLIENIEMAKSALIKAIKDLPFVSNVEFMP
jgi:hypothetical protein